MNTLLETEEEHQDHSGRRDREFTLGTSTVLGIFFALALLCAVFFGFGYSLGSRHTSPQPASPSDTLALKTFNGLKPAPGSPLNSPGKPAVNPYEPPPAEPQTIPSTNSQKATPAAFAPDPAPAHTPKATPAVTPPAAALPTAATPGAPQFVVQIAAVSHQEDADAIATSLKRRNYNVAIRQEPQDKLLHIQVGPFAARKDAETMRLNLLADGFNAYIK